MKKITAALIALALCATPALAQTSVSPDVANSRPESMAVGPDGTLYIGSQLDARIWRARPGQAKAEQFIDLRPSAFVLGVYVDTRSSTLYACEMISMDRGSPLLKGNGVVRSFDLASGKPKLRIPLPEAGNICNDFTTGPDGSIYIADTSNAQIFRLRPGASQLEKVIQHSALYGVDGLTFLDNVLYVNTVWAGNLYRIPMDATGKASNPVAIHAPRVLQSPDGMRAHNGRIYLAESGNGTVSSFTVKNDVATFTTLRTGLNGPCAVEPHGNVVWAVERPADRVTSIPIP
jgi:sugar lactone lactonase YvrE